MGLDTQLKRKGCFQIVDLVHSDKSRVYLAIRCQKERSNSAIVCVGKREVIVHDGRGTM